mgnify:CR=1 FL=1
MIRLGVRECKELPALTLKLDFWTSMWGRLSFLDICIRSEVLYCDYTYTHKRDKDNRLTSKNKRKLYDINRNRYLK